MDYSNIILELMKRIQNLEKEVEMLKQNGGTETQPALSSGGTPLTQGKRDTTRYMFEGNVYLKNRLVLAVVHAYVRDNPWIDRNELKSVFQKSLQGSIGVVEMVEIASRRPDYNVRFFTKNDEVIHLDDGDMYVCSQWGILNIPNFIKCAELLNYKIDAI